MAFQVWRADWVKPGKRDCELCSSIPLGDDMTLYYSGTSRQDELEELNLVGRYLENVNGMEGHYPWSQVQKELQEHTFPKHRSFSTWSSEEKRVDQVLNRQVPQKPLAALVLGPERKKTES